MSGCGVGWGCRYGALQQTHAHTCIRSRDLARSLLPTTNARTLCWLDVRHICDDVISDSEASLSKLRRTSAMCMCVHISNSPVIWCHCNPSFVTYAMATLIVRWSHKYTVWYLGDFSQHVSFDWFTRVGQQIEIFKSIRQPVRVGFGKRNQTCSVVVAP